MTPVRVPVTGAILKWARERFRLTEDDLKKTFPLLWRWETGDVQPTLKQLEQYARRTHAPIGYFFLPEPPRERLPIPDFRTNTSKRLESASADLLDTIYLCQQRQDWYREHVGSDAENSLPFAGSIVPESNVVVAATTIRNQLELDLDSRRSVRTWEEALSAMVFQAEELGVLVMRNGVVGNNTHRTLDRDEFRGFALSDSIAPLVFINAADSKSGQMFTLAHELVHIFAARSGVSDASPRQIANLASERWCNEVAAEVLVPLTAFRETYDPKADLQLELLRLARQFKVSTLVVLRRMYDAGGFAKKTFWTAYEAELARLKLVNSTKDTGGNFHATEAVRVSKRFATALVASMLESLTLYRDAFRLLSISKQETFNEFGASLGVIASRHLT